MFEVKFTEHNESFSQFRYNLMHSFSFAATGLTSVLRLVLLTKIREITKKKVLFVTSSEQNALRYQNDLKKAFDVDGKLLPFQNISM